MSALNAREPTAHHVGEVTSYGELEATGAYDLYRIQHNCGDGFRINVKSLNTTDVDLYLATGDPSVRKEATGNYSVSQVSTATEETYYWGSAPLGTYSLMIRHKVAETQYKIERVNNCYPSGGGYSSGNVGPVEYDYLN